MAKNKPRPSQPVQQASPPRMYSPDFHPLLQSLLATLADIDFEHEREHDMVTRRTHEVNLKIRVLDKLKQQHRERREPYVQQLAILQQRTRQVC